MNFVQNGVRENKYKDKQVAYVIIKLPRIGVVVIEQKEGNI